MYKALVEKLTKKNAKLIAVSKTQTVEKILEVYTMGQRAFGENRVQELVSKYEELPKDIEWHFIGTLQSNKVKYIAPFVHLIHSVSSFGLAKKINQAAQANDRIIDVLLQIKIATEDSKQGFDPSELKELLKQEQMQSLKNIRLRGLMGMATFTNNMTQVEKEFQFLNEQHKKLKSLYSLEYFDIKSMGMSGDFELAIDCGSNMVRIGSLLFGNRH